MPKGKKKETGHRFTSAPYAAKKLNRDLSTIHRRINGNVGGFKAPVYIKVDGVFHEVKELIVKVVDLPEMEKLE